MWYTEETFQSRRTATNAIRQYMQILRTMAEEDHGPFIKDGVVVLKGLAVTPAWEEILAKAPGHLRSVHTTITDKHWKGSHSASQKTFGAYVMDEFQKCLDSPKDFLKLVKDIGKSHVHALHVPGDAKGDKEPVQK